LLNTLQINKAVSVHIFHRQNYWKSSCEIWCGRCVKKIGYRNSILVCIDSVKKWKPDGSKRAVLPMMIMMMIGNVILILVEAQIHAREQIL
jgi:hypothetical protein